jgi:hydroxymethylpyrimidine/phosphomethylpyrimidine kinase
VSVSGTQSPTFRRIMGVCFLEAEQPVCTAVRFGEEFVDSAIKHGITSEET